MSYEIVEIKELPIEGLMAHKAAAKLVPRMSDEQFGAFADSVKIHHVRVPIDVLEDDRVIDGLHRIGASKAAGFKTIPARVLRFESEGEVWEHVYDMTLRRDLTPSQRAAIVVSLAEQLAVLRAAAADRSDSNLLRGKEAPEGDINPPRAIGKTRDLLAEKARTSGMPVRQLLKVVNAADVAEGEREDLLCRVRDGGVSAGDAARLATKYDRDDRTRVLGWLDDPVEAKVQSVKQGLNRLREIKKANARRAKKRQALFEVGDAKEFCVRHGKRSCDLLLTDPPYATDVEGDFEGWLDGWLEPVLETVKDSGRAFICCGAYPAELRAYLDRLTDHRRLELCNVMVWTYRNTIGPAKKEAFRQNWQAILHLKGKDAGPLLTDELNELWSVIDMAAPDARRGERFHKWQKPEGLADLFIRLTTKEGDTVLDPFCGSGTFPLVAAQLGRAAFGCDAAESAIELCIERGGKRAS